MYHFGKQIALENYEPRKLLPARLANLGTEFGNLAIGAWQLTMLLIVRG
jgi:hypothetical protein